MSEDLAVLSNNFWFSKDPVLFFFCLFVFLFVFNFGYLSVIVLLVLSAAGIVILVSFVCPLVDGDKRLMQAS